MTADLAAENAKLRAALIEARAMIADLAENRRA